MRSPSVLLSLLGARVFSGSSNVRLSTSRFRLTVSPQWSTVYRPHSTTIEHFFLLSSLLILCGSVCAQSTGSIEGQAVAEHGCVVEGAEITASCLAIGVKRIAKTDARGRYQFAALPVGDYRLEIRAHGFKEQILLVNRAEGGCRLTQN